MKQWKLAFLLLMFNVAIVNAVIDQEANGHGIDMETVAIGTGIEDREVIGKSSEFSASVGKVFCWMRVSVDATSTFKHVWSVDGEKVAEVPLEVKAPNGTLHSRHWSSKNVWPGHWKVEIVGPSEVKYATEEFVVNK